jgi:hypothetical protein
LPGDWRDTQDADGCDQENRGATADRILKPSVHCGLRLSPIDHVHEAKRLSDIVEVRPSDIKN